MLNEPSIQLTRARVSTLGVCDFCDEKHNDNKQCILAVTAFYTDMQVNLCKFHEGELLMVLLKNYTRRKRRGKKHGGFSGEIPSPEEVPDGTILNLEETDEDD